MRGFTLLETVIALTVIGLTLSVIFSLLSRSIKTMEDVKRQWEDFTYLDRAVKLGISNGINVEERKLEEYEVKVRIYKKGNVELILLE
ncbi:PulJ/GspJ family protein [Aquifex sp.]